MRRMLALAATFALAMSTAALAQNPNQDKNKHPVQQKRPPVNTQHVGPIHAPIVHQGPIRGPIVHQGPVGGPVHVIVRQAPWMFHGRSYAWHPVHYPHPWAYPPGYGYRLWGIGAILPPIFWSSPTYYYPDWAAMGLPPPDPGFQYVEYGPDLLLVNVATGEIVQVFPGAFS